MSNKQSSPYPSFLQDYGSLLSHFNAQFEGLNSRERGDRFVDFVRKLVPHTPTGERFDAPKVRKHSYDEGVDLECTSLDGREILNVQSKLTVRDVDEIDRIVSKFRAFQANYANENTRNLPVQQGLLDENGPISDVVEAKIFQFMIITTSDMTENIRRYGLSKRPSVEFFELLMRENRIHLVDGPKLLPILQKTYRKLHVIPSNFVVTFSADTIKLGNVSVGVISSLELSNLYNEFGDALFIENIREFLGSPRNRKSLTDVNREILETLEQNPEQFLSKNNGITFRASRVEPESSRTLKLFDASIVNGLQTTLSVIQKPSSECFVLVKIVESQNSWGIAKAANFQNKVERIDLDLAEYIRPRDIQTAASKAGIGYYYDKEADNVFAVLDVIYNDRISYQEIRSLFIGIFSRNPNNTIDPDYGQLRTQIIEELYRHDPGGEATFNTLFKIQKMIQRASVEAQSIFRAQEYADVFQRFWEEAKPNYRAYIAILAICGCVRQNIYERNTEIDYATMSRFLDDVAAVIDRKPEVFVRYFRHAFKAVANQQFASGQGKDYLLQRMQAAMHRAKFSPLYLQMCVSADDDDKLRELESK